MKLSFDRAKNGLAITLFSFAFFGLSLSALRAQEFASGTPSSSAGGGSLANYNDLIQLIQSTIDAEWVANGGTASLMPFPNGVRLSTTGVIQRIDSVGLQKGTLRLPISIPAGSLKEKSKSILASMDSGHLWQEHAALRWVSLNQLDSIVAERLAKKQKASASMELLAGLVRIDYVAFDSKSQEWFLGGPAGKLVLNEQQQLIHADLALPPVLLEDLLSIAPHVLLGRGDLGCTIEPDEARLRETHQAIQSEAELRKLQKSPEDWEQLWRNRLGNQEARVIGLPQNSPTGYAMLLADAHMKRVAFELESRPFKMKSYWQEADFLQPKSDRLGLVRWWFSLTDSLIPMDPERHIYHLKNSNLQVLSESQMMNEAGQRHRAIQADLAADAFARNFTHWFESLQRTFPIYGRLRHQCDLAVAMEIIRIEQAAGRGTPFVAINQLSIQPLMATTPREIESIAATHITPTGRVAAIVSGGVSFELRSIQKRLITDRTETNRVSVERSLGDRTDEAAASSPNRFWRD